MEILENAQFLTQFRNFQSKLPFIAEIKPQTVVWPKFIKKAEILHLVHEKFCSTIDDWCPMQNQKLLPYIFWLSKSYSETDIYLDSTWLCHVSWQAKWLHFILTNLPEWWQNWSEKVLRRQSILKVSPMCPGNSCSPCKQPWGRKSRKWPAPHSHTHVGSP